MRRPLALMLGMWVALCGSLALAGSGYTPPPAASGVSGNGSGVTDAAAFRTALSLGTAATTASTDYCAADATLAALAGATCNADTLIYCSGADTVASGTITAAGRALIDDADAGAQRTTLGLGTAATSASSAFQSADATLTAWAGATCAASTLLYCSGSDVVSGATLTAAGLAILDDASAGAQRTTLGLGTAATMDAGTGAGQVVYLDGSAKLPAVDGSALTNLPSSGIGGTAGGTDNRIIRANGTGDTVQGSALTCDDSGNLSGVGNITLSGTVDGVDVSGIPAYAQSSDVEIAALAGTTSGADALPYYTGSGSATTTTLTSAARSLLDDTTAAAMRATLGVSATADVQAFTADGTWTEPAGATAVLVVTIGGGGGGGGGRQDSASSHRGGGTGGGAGGWTMITLPASLTGPTEAVVAGTGGPGGANLGHNNSANGNPGTDGEASSFGSWAYASGGTGGLGGTSVSGASGQPGGLYGQAGGTGGNTGSTNGSAGSSAAFGGGGGGGAGSVSSGNGTGTGGAGGAGSLAKSATGLAGATGAVAAGSAGGNGTSATAGAPFAGGGGAGGGSSGTAGSVPAGVGGNGGLYGGGGGGGGGGLKTAGYGAAGGGNGADGIVVVVTW